MRYRLPAALAAATILLGAGTASATKHVKHHARLRLDSHVSLHVSRHSLLSGQNLVVRGRARPRGPQRIKIVVRGRSGGVASVKTRANGIFRMSWGLRQTGIYAVRAYGIHDRNFSGSRSAPRRFTVYRRAVASYYGPGLYGNGVACGGTLQPGTLGVANKTLPCGTMVRLRYHGRSVTVPVIVRGPYVAGREYDLTEATRQRLHFPGLGVVLSSR
ncbi:MAG: septal ring lytic transglycosylase RlpA family protein [Solirubrobacterales bacterium]